jgi:hypothetical protein
MRSFVLKLSALASIATASPLAADPRPPEPSTAALPPIVQRTAPGPGHKALEPLLGDFRVEKQLFVAIGTPEHPARSEGMTTHREWIGDGRFLHDVTRGSIGGQPYYRAGFLGYNNMEQRYEWTTADNFTPILMSYRAKARNGIAQPIQMSGTFTDPGVTGEANVGKSIPMRTVIKIESPDRHVFELYFTAPGKPEVLADRMVFTRVKP